MLGGRHLKILPTTKNSSQTEVPNTRFVGILWDLLLPLQFISLSSHFPFGRMAGIFSSHPSSSKACSQLSEKQTYKQNIIKQSERKGQTSLEFVLHPISSSHQSLLAQKGRSMHSSQIPPPFLQACITMAVSISGNILLLLIRVVPYIFQNILSHLIL